jgi:hypothetical protein
LFFPKVCLFLVCVALLEIALNMSAARRQRLQTMQWKSRAQKDSFSNTVLSIFLTSFRWQVFLDGLATCMKGLGPSWGYFWHARSACGCLSSVPRACVLGSRTSEQLHRCFVEGDEVRKRRQQQQEDFERGI